MTVDGAAMLAVRFDDDMMVVRGSRKLRLFALYRFNSCSVNFKTHSFPSSLRYFSQKSFVSLHCILRIGRHILPLLISS